MRIPYAVVGLLLLLNTAFAAETKTFGDTPEGDAVPSVEPSKEKVAYNERPFPGIMSRAELDRIALLAVNVDSASELHEHYMAKRRTKMLRDCTAVALSVPVCECLTSFLPVGIANFALYAGVMLRKDEIELEEFSELDRTVIQATFAARRKCQNVASGRQTVTVEPYVTR